MKYLLPVLVCLALPVKAEDICQTSAPLLSQATLRAGEKATAVYRGIAWAPVPSEPSLQEEMRHAHVQLLRKRLMAEKDLTPGTRLSSLFDDEVAEAVRRFQQRYGLPVTGIVDRNTLAAMNVPAEERALQLAANTAKLEALVAQASPAERRVTVNIPAANVEAVEGDVVVGRYRAVAGSSERPSPELATEIIAVNFHPGWTVPPTIVKEELLPKLASDPGYLERTGLVLSKGSYRLPPGPRNPMGEIKLEMPNREQVYMHDTPSKRLFSRSLRFMSSGCVRVEDIQKLSAWLLEWNDRQVNQAVVKKSSRTVKLNQPVPVEWVYVTAWATAERVACFRPDVYQKVATRRGGAYRAVAAQTR